MGLWWVSFLPVRPVWTYAEEPRIRSGTDVWQSSPRNNIRVAYALTRHISRLPQGEAMVTLPFFLYKL